MRDLFLEDLLTSKNINYVYDTLYQKLKRVFSPDVRMAMNVADDLTFILATRRLIPLDQKEPTPLEDGTRAWRCEYKKNGNSHLAAEATVTPPEDREEPTITCQLHESHLTRRQALDIARTLTAAVDHAEEYDFD